MEKNELFEGLVGRIAPADQEEYSLGVGDRSSYITFPVIFSTLVAVSDSYAFGNAVGYSSPVANGIMEDLGLSVAEYAVFGSANTVGGMLGALFSGKIADIFGRRGAMGISDIFCITGWLAILFSKVPVYVAEITTKDIRGAFSSLNVLMIACGKALMYVIASLINWPTSALIGVIPCVLQLIGVFFIPESPRWLAENNQTKEFETALQRLRGKNADISKESADIREGRLRQVSFMRQENTEYLQQISKGGIRDLFQQKYKNSMTVGVGILVFQQLSGLNGFSYYASFIFESAGLNSTFGSIAVAVLQIFMCIMGVLFIDKSG